MKFKITIDKSNKNPYDLSKISYKCVKCGGKQIPPTIYEMNGYTKYCKCK